MNELYLNDQLCDLSDFTLIAVTKQVNDLGELQNRNGNFTNTFKLPLTQRNIAIIGQANVVTSNSDIPYKKLTARYVQNGIDIVANGQAYIDSVDDFINVFVTSGNASLSEMIGDLTVGDLYDGETFTFDFATASEFPLINWRTDIDNFLAMNLVDVRNLLPTLYVSDIFDRLSTRLSIAFQGSYLTSPFHTQMVITPSDWNRNKSLTLNSGIWSNGGISDIQFFTITGVGGTGETSVTVLPKTNVFSNSEFSQSVVPSFNPGTNQTGRLKYTTQVYTFRTGTSNANKTIRIIAYIYNDTTGLMLTSYSTEVYTSRMNVGDIGNFVISFQTDEMTFVTTDTYVCVFDVITEVDNDDTFLRVSIPVTKFEFQQSDKITYGSDVAFSDVFRTKIKDLFKDVLNMSCLSVAMDDYSGIVSIDYLNDLFTNTPLDWTSKLHNDTNPLSFQFGKYARRNWLRFKNNTNVTDNLGDDYFDVSDENLEAEKDAVKFNHPATEQSSISGLNICRIKGLNDKNEWQKPDYRLLQLTSQPIDFEITLTDDDSTTTTTTAKVCSFISATELLPNYDVIRSMLDHAKVIKLPFKLTETDIQNVNFMRPIYIESMGLFYLNKIENFKGGVTYCELIRL